MPKVRFFRNFGTKNPNLRQISYQNFRNNPFISLFRQSQAGKRLQSFEVQPEGFPKTSVLVLLKMNLQIWCTGVHVTLLVDPKVEVLCNEAVVRLSVSQSCQDLL